MGAKKTATLSVVVTYDPDQATPQSLARMLNSLVARGISNMPGGIRVFGCGNFWCDMFSVTEAEGYKTEVEEHNFWEHAAKNGLIDSVGSVEWMRVKAGTRFVSEPWLSRHQVMLDNGVIPLER